MVEDLYNVVKGLSDVRGENMSTFIRRSILRELAMLGYLDNDQRQALGL